MKNSIAKMKARQTVVTQKNSPDSNIFELNETLLYQLSSSSSSDSLLKSVDSSESDIDKEENDFGLAPSLKVVDKISANIKTIRISAMGNSTAQTTNNATAQTTNNTTSREKTVTTPQKSKKSLNVRRVANNSNNNNKKKKDTS